MWRSAPLFTSLLAPLDRFLPRTVVCAAMNFLNFEKYFEFLSELSHATLQAVAGLEDLFNDGRG
jgi:hypothetical protein